ncbi:SusC/RagA family TonB-linked outer membrane protein [Sphingobacterium siyangense]|uniref:SusC/RagA family TonB-linked outer membrane protein n=1 Tax=Sphingobacterium siyangense TaxID=459529 RepID=A0A420FAV5_9SPHI|nr:TonB-dependent receptor [Sphingobacterium siyangense]RKF30082.1 SusC/RagA family TonB-linked outer membrane protein [Sphingobacterium siyangense]
MKTNFIFNERPLPWNKLRSYPWQWALSSLLLLSPMATIAQQQQIEGKVQTSKDKPIAGASITELRTGHTTSSDGQGRFKISASPGDKLVITFVGYRKTEMIVGQQRLMDVLLNEDNTSLEEVVVVGYGTQKKASLTGAISSVNNKEITVTKNENVVNMLAGKMPGVRISQQSSQPGSFESNIDIRGMGEPLIVVDGIPRDKDYLSRMDANEIESVSVLKDASAAVYGVRSANGVLLVTTRRGSNEDGNFEINYSYNRAWQKFLYVPNTVDALAYMQLKNEQIGRDFNSNYPAKMPNIFGPADFEAYQNGTKKTSNYVDAAFDKVSPQYQHNLSINGGGKKVNYFFNLGHMDQMGAYKSKSLNYNRWNFRSNIDAQITDRLKATLDVGGYADETNQPRTDIWAVYKQAWRQRPIVPIYVNDNPLYPNFEMIDNENPVVVTDSKQTGYRKFLRKQFNGIISLDYKVPFVEGLNAKATYNYDFKYSDNTDFKKSYFLYSYTPPVYDGNGQIITPEKYNAHEKNAPTTVRRSSYPDTHSLMQFSLNYNRRFAEKHQVSGLLLFVEEYNKWDSFYAQREIMVNSEYLFAGEDKNQLANMEGIGERTARGLVGKFNYDYLGKYIAEFSFRYDGSSKFPKESRWGFFPAASVGWRISEEGFIKNNYNFINNLKIRASYGKLGDDRSAGNYPSTIVGYALEPNETGWIFGGNLVNGALPTAIPNPNLTWYTSKTADVGLDMDLWNGKLGLTFDYFNRNRSGLLATSLDLIPGTVGANLPQENLESDRTFGYELSLTHRNKINDFNYFINAQVSSTKSQFVNRVESKAGNSYDNWRNRYSNRNKDIWWGKEYAGQFGSYEQIYNHPTLVSSGTLPGDYYYQDWNGDGVINDADNHPIATYNMPLVNYGFTLGGSWRGLDLTMNFQGAAKVYVQYSEVLAGPLQFDGGALTQFLDRWRPVDAGADLFNPSTQWLAGYYPSTGSAMAEGTRAVQNASYLRLKTLELGYSLPQQWLKILKIKNLRIYASAYNLLTWTGLKYTDPEHPGSAGGSSSGDIDVYKYPINKTYNIGASIKF